MQIVILYRFLITTTHPRCNAIALWVIQAIQNLRMRPGLISQYYCQLAPVTYYWMKILWMNYNNSKNNKYLTFSHICNTILYIKYDLYEYWWLSCKYCLLPPSCYILLNEIVNLFYTQWQKLPYSINRWYLFQRYIMLHCPKLSFFA